jgi:hypothetical protein
VIEQLDQFCSVDEVESLRGQLDLSKLKSNSEKPFQALLTGACDIMRAVNSSENSSGFHIHQMVGSLENVYPWATKPDLCSKVCPMVIEIKPSPDSEGTGLVQTDIEVIAQAMERAYVARCTNAMVKKFIAIAITYRSAWVIDFSRTIDLFPDDFEEIRVKCIFMRSQYKSGEENIWKVWIGYTNMSLTNNTWYLTEDAFHLYSTLSCITHPKYSLTRLIASSLHRVYGVKLPSYYSATFSNQSMRSIFGVTDNEYDYCVKVMHNEQSYLKESQAVKVISVKYNSYNLDRHYAVGVHPLASLHSSFASSTASSEENISADVDLIRISEQNGNDIDTDTTTSFSNVIKDVQSFVNSVNNSRHNCLTLTRRLFSEKDSYWQTIESSNNPYQGGTILMRLGKIAKLSINNFSSWLDGVHLCLRATHEAGYFHCDIRESNVILFGQVYQVIDYDRSVPITEPNFAFVTGAQYDNRGLSLRSHVVGDDVEWTYHDDYQMVSTTLAKLKPSD